MTVILGKCPACGRVGAVIGKAIDKFFQILECEHCHKQWHHSRHVTRLMKKSVLILVRLERYSADSRYHAALLYVPHSTRIVWKALIEQALFMAAQLKFKSWDPMRFKKIAEPNRVGLYSKPHHLNLKVLEWTRDMLDDLAAKKLVWLGKRFGRGEILQLTDNPDNEVYVRALLWMVLANREGESFAETVFSRAGLQRATVPVFVEKLTMA